MITLDKWTTIRILFEEGRSKKEIARVVGVSRNTVKRILKQDSHQKYSRKPKENKVIAPYTDQIKEGLKKELIGTRIFNDIKKEGYEGSYTTLTRYIKTIKHTVSPQKTTIRFETEPGEQAQFDWSPYTINLDGKEVTVYCFLFILSYSRKKIMSFSLEQSATAVVEALENGLRGIGGVPGTVVIDNGKQMIIHHKKNGTLTYHKDFIALAGIYRFIPYACEVYWPRTKGKVERPFYYIENHFIKGNSFVSIDELNQRGQTFLTEWEKQPNQTTLVPPAERFKEDKHCLKPLPTILYAPSMKETRKVSWDCLISFRGVRYSIPHQYAGKRVWIRISQGYLLEVYSENGEYIDQHAVSFKKGETITKDEHYEGLKGTLPKSLPKLREAFIHAFSSGKLFINLLEDKIRHNHGSYLQKILELQHSYELADIETALQEGVKYKRVDYAFFKHILRNTPRKKQDYTIKNKTLPEVRLETRSLDYYSQLLQ